MIGLLRTLSKTMSAIISYFYPECSNALVLLTTNTISIFLLNVVARQHGILKWGSITVPLTSCLTGLELAV